MMEQDDQRIIFAAFALMGLIASRSPSPKIAAELIWQYADEAVNYKEPKENE